MADCSQSQPKKWKVETASLNLIKKELESYYLLLKFMSTVPTINTGKEEGEGVGLRSLNL